MKRKKPGARLVAVIDADLDEMMRDVVARNRTLTISGFVQDAIAVRLANYEPPADYVRRKRGDKGVAQQEVFDSRHFDRYGFPLQLRPDAPLQELRYASKRGEAGVRELLRTWWGNNGLDPDAYTDAMLRETLRQLDAEP